MEPLISVNEKRKGERFDIRLPIHYVVKGKRHFGNTITKNLSESGVGIVLDEFIPPSTDIFLEVNLASKAISALGKIVWVKQLPSSYRYKAGIKFAEIDALEKRDISEYLGSYHFNTLK